MAITGTSIRLVTWEPDGTWLSDPDEFTLGDLGGVLPSVGDCFVRFTSIGGERSYLAYRVVERIFLADPSASPGEGAEPMHVLVVKPLTFVEGHERALGLPSKGTV